MILAADLGCGAGVMRYLSVCSGIEAATCAWHHLGWQPVAFSEVEPFPCADGEPVQSGQGPTHLRDRRLHRCRQRPLVDEGFQTKKSTQIIDEF